MSSPAIIWPQVSQKVKLVMMRMTQVMTLGEGVSLDETTGCNAVIDGNTQPQGMCNGQLRQASTLLQVSDALKALKLILHPPWKTGAGSKHCKLDPFVSIHLEGMQTMLNFYTNAQLVTYKQWGASALQAAISLGRGQYCARQRAKLSRQFVSDCSILPINPYGEWNESMLMDEDLASNINLHLQELGKNISAKKIIEFLKRSDVMDKHGITRKISERMACQYLKTLSYHFMAPKKGQYADGHEHADVV